MCVVQKRFMGHVLTVHVLTACLKQACVESTSYSQKIIVSVTVLRVLMIAWDSVYDT